MENQKNAFLSLLKKLDIEPKNYSLYLEAFTTSSYANDKRLPYNYEKLELLGDSIITFVVTQYLFDKFKNLSVGELSEYRRTIVQSKSEILTAKKLKLEDCLYIGRSFESNHSKDRFLEDTYESLIAAIYLDAGFIKAKEVVINTLLKDFNFKNISDDLTDYKTKFQELMRKFSKKSIQYKVVQDIPNNFKVELWSDKICYGKGSGKKIKEAEQNAAKEGVKKFIGKKRVK